MHVQRHKIIHIDSWFACIYQNMATLPEANATAVIHFMSFIARY